jgi:hypothetical protein
MNFNTNDSVVEKALLQMKTIEEAISENAKRNTCFYNEGRNQ